MICYKDMTFCDYWKDCKKGISCGRSLTRNVKQNANELGLPIAQFVEKPKCFKE